MMPPMMSAPPTRTSPLIGITKASQPAVPRPPTIASTPRTAQRIRRPCSAASANQPLPDDVLLERGVEVGHGCAEAE